MDDRTLYTKSEGAWCDNCRTAFRFVPADENCPQRHTAPMRPATITVEVHGLGE